MSTRSSAVRAVLLVAGIALAGVSCTSDTTGGATNALEPSGASFSATLHAGSDSTIQTLAIASGVTPVQWTATPSVPWIRLSATSGQTPSAIIITLKSDGLAPGTYTGTISVSAQGVTNSPVSFVVNLTVTAQPVLVVTSDSLRFAGVVGQADLGSQSIHITNGGTGTLSWTASPSDSWISVSPLSGTGAGTVAVRMITTGLAAGTLHGTVTIAATGATGSPVVVPVTLVLSAPQPVTFTIATASAPAAGGATSGGGTFAAGSNITIGAAPNSGYTFSNWTENGTVVSTSQLYSFAVSGNRSLVANFAVVQPSNVTIATSSNPPAGGTTSGGGSFAPGTSVTVSATPNAGYTFNSWTENGANVSSSMSFTFTASSDRTLVANFVTVQPSNVTIATSSNPSNGGTTSGGGTFAHGTSVTVTATPVPNSGYTFNNWTENGNVASTSASYTFNAVFDRTLVANFTTPPPTNVTITTSSNPVFPNATTGDGSYAPGASVTVTAARINGYVFLNWTENGTVVSTSESYTFTAATSRTLVANWRQFYQNLVVTTLESYDGGPLVWHANTNGSGIYAEFSPATVRAGTLDGFIFSAWTDRGTVVSTSATYTFTVTRNDTLVAQFVRHITVRIDEPEFKYAVVGDAVNIGLDVASPNPVASVVATVAGRQFTLTTGGGTVDLSGLRPVGDTLVIVVVAKDVNGDSAVALIPVIHDAKPVVTVASPAENSIANPTFNYSATCTDDGPAGCVSLTLVTGSNQTLASGTSSISGTATLAGQEGHTVTLHFFGQDSRGQITDIIRHVVVQ